MNKSCTKCHQEKPLTDFPISRKDLTGKSRYHPSCKACMATEQRARYRAQQAAKQPTPSLAVPEGTKICSVCKVAKPRSEFSPNSRAKDKLSYRCRGCCRDYARKVRAEKPPSDAKTCSYCGGMKKRSEFPAHMTAKDGLQSHCKTCHREIGKIAYAKRKANRKLLPKPASTDAEKGRGRYRDRVRRDDKYDNKRVGPEHFLSSVGAQEEISPLLLPWHLDLREGAKNPEILTRLPLLTLRELGIVDTRTKTINLPREEEAILA